jgi:hypothetical protein
MKRGLSSRVGWVALAVGLVSVCPVGFIFGDEAITNWAAPAFWSPPRVTRGATRGVTTQGDVTSPLPFIGVTPCRVVDTRGANGAFGGPIFSAGQTRTYPLSTNPACPGFPAASTIAGYSVNITVTQTAGTGFISAFPSGTSLPLVSSVNFVGAGQSVSNAAIVPAGSGGNAGKIDIYASQQTHVIIDVNGYYGNTPANSLDTFEVHNSSGWAILGHTASSGFLSRGVFGIASATTGETKGVFGETDSSSDRAAGVEGYAPAATGKTYGVRGVTLSTFSGAAGVYGVASTGVPSGFLGFSGSAGVRGDSAEWGVVGSSTGAGVAGFHVDSSGAIQTTGRLGSDATYGVFAAGNIGCSSCVKPFIDPHPTDPTKEIVYVALEGPEAGTYFRGRGRIHNGTGVIEVPESFRLVSDEEGLTVQITPIGQIANVAVVSADLNTIMVRSSARDLEFYYVVNGVHRPFKDWNAIQENRHYVPEGPNARMPGVFAPEHRRALIATGIYNEDGTVNLETAERLGWAKAWRDREQQARAAAAAYRAAREAKGENK